MEKQKKINSDWFSHVVTILFVVYSIFRTYELFGIRISELADYVLILIYLCKYGITSKVLPHKLNVYFVFWIFSVLFSSVWTGWDGLRPLLGVFHTYLLYMLFFSKSDFNLLIKYYRIVGLICISFLFLQELSVNVTGIRFSGLIPGLNVVKEFGSADDFNQMLINSPRSSSFFSEPAIFVQFLLPLLAIELFWAKDNKRNIRCTFIFLALLLLQSGNAMFGIAAIFSIYLIKRLKESGSFKTIIATLVILVVSFSGIAYYLSTEQGQSLLARQDQLSMTDYESGQSGFIRIYRGYFVYDNLNFIEKIIGVNDFSTLHTRIKTSSVKLLFGQNETYFNAVQDMLIKTGVIGISIFILLIVDLWRNDNYCGRSLLLCLVCLCFISAIYLTNTMAMFLYLALKTNK